MPLDDKTLQKRLHNERLFPGAPPVSAVRSEHSSISLSDTQRGSSLFAYLR